MTDRACILLTLAAVAVFSAYVIFMETTQSFDARCKAVYAANTPQHELCVARLSDGGPLHEENIGKIT